MNRSRCLFRGLTALLAVLVAVSSFCLPASASAFSDVTRSAYYAYFDAINYVSDNGYMAGTGNGKFSPDRTLNRGMFVTVLYSFAGKPLATGTIPFTDVSSTAYYYQAVRWAYANGVLSGTTSTTFSPDMEVNREQAMVILKSYAVKWLGKDAYYCETVTSAGDYSNISSWARDAMRWAVSNGILIRANAFSNLYPKAAAARKELALWICRFGQNVIGLDVTKDTFSFKNNSEDFISPSYNKYLLSAEHWYRLLSFANKEDKEGIRELQKKPWNGVCFGMTVSCLLDKRGQIDFNGNYANNCSNLFAIPSPKTGRYSGKNIQVTDFFEDACITQAESTINFYLLAQNITAVLEPSEHARYLSKASVEDDSELEGAEEFVAAMKHGGLALMCIGGTTGASSSHSIIVYGYPNKRTETNGKTLYIFQAYDPNSDTKSDFVLRKDRSTFVRCTFRGSTIGRAYYYTDFRIFDAFDIDGEGNNIQSISDAHEPQ